ncbi:isocitrate/isopropylmalate dehydrogenase family protein [Pyrolobus fumarii]|uniref:isocitrate/isopropylmalate dehydrogenase family protein n=1 Tax=Pyrolobus fumarii TaxID=54252 RepID=UPI00064F8684|nr:isocitrate/isopropylmalate family dehydrogenase [Pyrolobus fumarii]
MTVVRFCLIEGDGIGPEVSRATLRVLEAVSKRFGIGFEPVLCEAGDEAAKRRGSPLPEETLRKAKEIGIVLKGPVGETAGEVVTVLRRELGTYAAIRPAKTLPGVSPRCGKPLDVVIVRELLEGVYVQTEYVDVVSNSFAVALRVASARETERVARLAARIARGRRGIVSIIHKANVLHGTCGLFRDVAKRVLEEEGVVVEEYYVDAAAALLVRTPERFDVMLTPNLFGDILSDLAAELAGSLGLSPSANVGDKTGIFEPVHGAAFDIAGMGIANPTAMMLAAAMMLDWLGYRDAARAIEKAIEDALASGARTPDLGGNLKTMEFAEEVAKRIEAGNA